VVPERQEFWAQRALEICDVKHSPLQFDSSVRSERVKERQPV
jgi:hypothetical protein